MEYQIFKECSLDFQTAGGKTTHFSFFLFAVTVSYCCVLCPAAKKSTKPKEEQDVSTVLSSSVRRSSFSLSEAGLDGQRFSLNTQQLEARQQLVC